MESQFDTDGSVLFVVQVDAGYQVMDCDPAMGTCAPLSDVEPEPFRLINWDT